MKKFIFLTLLFLSLTEAFSTPTIGIRANNILLNSNDTIDLGSVAIGSTASIEIFIVNQSTGSFSLRSTATQSVDTLQFDLPLVITGTDFSISTQPSNDSIFGMDSLPFTVLFSPSCNEGMRVSTISIANNDPTNSPFIINLKGTVVDDTPPIALCTDTTIFLSALGTATIDSSFINNGSSDNCGLATLELDRTTFTCTEFNFQTVTLTATDIHGNQAMCQAQVEVRDTITPTISCPPSIEQCITSNIVTYTLPTGADNCSFGITQTNGLGSGSTFPIGTTTETFLITDTAGNTNTCSFDVTIFDLPSDAIAGNDQVICDSSSSLNATAPSIGIGTWTVLNGSSQVTDTNNATSTIITLPIGSTSIQWSVSNGVCPTSVDTVSIQRDAEPTTANAGNDQLFCNSNQRTIAANTPIIGSGIWNIIQGNAGITNNLSAITTVTTLSADTIAFTWTITNGVCPSSIDTVVLRNDQIPDVSDAGANRNVCNFFDTIQANTPETGVGNWEVASGSGFFLDATSPTTIVSGLAVGANELIWRITNGTCPDNIDTITITRFEVPTADAGDNVTLCVDNTFLNATPPTIGVGQWIGPADVIIDDPSDPATQVSNLQDGTNTFFWLVTNGTEVCSALSSVEITRNDDLTISDAGADEQICADTTTNLPANTPTAGSGAWSQISGTGNIINVSDPNSLVTGLAMGANTYVWTITSIGCTPNSDTVSIFRDGVAPEIVCPNDTTVFASAILCGNEFTYIEPIGTDNCPGVRTALDAGLASGQIFPIGTTTNTFMVTDTLGLTATCSFNVTVADTTPPIITCADTITQATTVGICGRIVNFSTPTAVDNCTTGLLVTQTDATTLASGSEFPVGLTQLDYSTIDSVGNTASCSIIIEIIDNEIPTIVCPNDTVFTLPTGSCDAFITYNAPIGNDNCPNFTTTQLTGNASGSAFTPGITTNTSQIEDASGNQATCSFDVTINEIDAPTISCPNDTILTATQGLCGTIVDYNAPTGNDLCGNVTIVQTTGLTSGSEFPVGITINQFIIEDESGNQDSCSFTVTVLDQEKPLLTCTDTVTQPTTLGLCETAVTFTIPVGVDNCPGVLTTQTDITGLTSGDIFPEGFTTLEYTATDVAGNDSICSIVVHVVDSEDPTITCPNDTTLTTAIGECIRSFFFTAPTGNDNCGILSTIQTDNSGLTNGSNFPIGTTTLTYTTTDLSSNIATCSFNITVTDDNDPIIVCPNDTIVENTIGNCGAVVTYITPIGTDLCTNVSTNLSSGLTSGSFFPVGTTANSFLVEDEAGNTATCSFTVEVQDTEQPQLICRNDTTLSTINGTCNALVNFASPTAFDNCSDTSQLIITQVMGLSSGSLFPLGTTLIGFTATDSSGNVSDTCFFRVIVEDNEAPTINCPNDIELCAADTVFFTTPSASDNCTSNVTVSLTSGLGSGSFFPIGIHQEVFLAEDASGNTATCNTTITVFDTTTVPTVGPDDTICGNTRTIVASNLGISTGEWSLLSGSGIITDTLAPNTTITGLTEGISILTWTSTFGSCAQKIDSLIITSFDTPSDAVILANNPLVLCNIDTVTLQNQPIEIGTLAWNIGGTQTDTTLFVTLTQEDTTQAILTVMNGPTGICPINSDTVTIIYSINTELTVTSDTSIFFGDEVLLEAISSTPNLNYTWSPTSSLTSPTSSSTLANPTIETTYTIIATNQFGCAVSDSVTISILDEIEVLTGITPNSDGKNDTWIIRGINKYPNAEIKEFNQWGRTVFESIGYLEPWDASFNDETVPFGAYYYTIDLRDGGAPTNGVVTVIR